MVDPSLVKTCGGFSFKNHGKVCMSCFTLAGQGYGGNGNVEQKGRVFLLYKNCDSHSTLYDFDVIMAELIYSILSEATVSCWGKVWNHTPENHPGDAGTPIPLTYLVQY